MGCSPSKGKLFSKQQDFGVQKVQVLEASHERLDCGPVLVEDTCLKPQDKEEESLQLTDEHYMKETSLTLQDFEQTLSENVMATEVNTIPQGIITDPMHTHATQKVVMQKGNIRKRCTGRQRKSSVVQTKVDFPPHMVRAHQAAYSFLNPNISKYETLLGLLDQATQTQLSLKPVISALELYFEEINQALEEMAEEGEMMLKEHGDSMILPSGMLCQAVRSAKPSPTPLDNFDPPLDLLQQLLQQSSEKMRQVQISAKTLGDNTLEEAIDYFSSMSQLFAGKLLVKKAAELRLAEVLARVEAAAIRKSNPEDSALHSEDSGIGGESESLTGSERQQRHRGSAGSGSCGSEVNIRGILPNCSNNLASLDSYNKDDEEEDKEEEGEIIHEYDENDQFERKRSSSSPPDPCHALCYMQTMMNQQNAFKCFTATKTKHSLSNSCMDVITDLNKGQKELDENMKKNSAMQGLNDFVRPDYNLYQHGFRRHSLNGSSNVHKSQARANQPPCSLSSLEFPPKGPLKRHSVKRLINTFSQGIDGRPGQSLSHILPNIKRPNKNGILQVSNVGNSNGGDIVTGNNNRSCPDGRDDLDMDNLPPPPLEVLMDNSFQHNEGQLKKERINEDPCLSLPLINNNKGASQRRKIVLLNVEVLPNKANVRPRLMAISPLRQEGFTEAKQKQLQLETEMFVETEKTKRLCNQARKIIHLCNAGESSDKKNVLSQISGDLTSLPATNIQRSESNEILEHEVPSCNLPVMAPPVSRVRLPPSCPSVRQSFQRPPMFRTHSRSSSCSNSPQTVTCANDKNTEHIIPSVSFHDARSVFCQNELQSSQARPSSGSTLLPNKWGEVTRGRSSTRGRDNTTRRTQSEQRPGMTSYSELNRGSVDAPTNQ